MPTNRQLTVPLASLILTVGSFGCLSYQDRGTSTDVAEALPGAAQPNFEKYRSPITARVTDRRFLTRDAMYLANELNFTGFPFFESALVGGLIGNDPDFQYMTTVESYWYSRYNMSALVTESRLGLHIVYGPYVSEWALRAGRGNVNRDRGEYLRSNKSVLLQEIIPLYLTRSGFPRRFEDASPSMLQFASGDPHLTRELDKGIAFQSTENITRRDDLRKIYGDVVPDLPSGMGSKGNDMWTHRINYRENFLTLRWDHSDMEYEIDLAAEGQTLMKQALWMEYFFRGSHHRGKYLGNDPEEGFRACMLNLMAVNKMLMLKAAMFYDGEKLGGVDPRQFEAGAHYLPHRVGVRMRLVGDLPPRPEEFFVVDDSSQLFDLGSLLWGLSEYYHFADPTVESNWTKVFGRPPFDDGSVMEQKYSVLADGLSGMLLKNLAAMHLGPQGVLVSEWTPESGLGAVIDTHDLGMAMMGLANYARHVRVQPENIELARSLLADQADFLLDTLRESDGSVASSYNFTTGTRNGDRPALQSQAIAVRGLLEAYKILKDERYVEGAKSCYAYMNSRLWSESVGVYRSSLDAEVSVYTPLSLGATIGAMREMILLNKDKQELERFKRFWVQGIDSSGIQQSEYEETGEKDFSLADGDGDGIPRMEFGDGKYGLAPVFAARVEIETPVR